ncbi:outer membrane channel protein TolC [Idiomarina tyrosinivorans]|uniref:Outer membrane channel protein TolC n=1 Tax=Idiomarina tyrosinivorans TaxID=1445662 RepID=A0A432ZG64_9GAMM|nr:outer membrane channel protein TolC [Idiomarina tyrosinivorans]RUO76921.1 outer membrane channel protein TolC [Idiomarina tyrosinivorans]
MKKHLLSALVGLALGSVSMTSSADDLKDVYQLALKNDPTLLRAAALKNAAQQKIDIADSAFWPQVTGSVGYNKSMRESVQANDSGQLFTYDLDSTSFDYGVTLNQSVFDWGVWKNADIADKQAYQAEVNYRNAQQELMLRVVNAYFAVLQAKDDLAFAQAEKKAIARQLEQTKQRFSVGLTAITDVHEAQAQYDSAVAREIKAQNAVLVAREGLREITGQQHNDLATLDTKSFSPAKPQPAEVQQWVKIAEEKNLSLMAEKIGVEIAQQQIDLAQTGHYPTVSLQARYSASNSESTISIQNQEQTTDLPTLDTKSIGVQVDVPIFSGFRTSSEVEQARFNYVASSQQMTQVYRNVQRNVRSAYYDVVASLASINAFEQAVVSAESALKATQAGFEVGTRTIVDVLDSTRNLYNAKRNLSQARYGYIRQILTLEQAAGNISEEDLLAINASLKETAQ